MLLAGLVASGLAADAVAASAVGDATVVAAWTETGGGDPVPISRAGGSVPFSLWLDLDTAECSGDSADEHYRVQSYMVPVSVSPGELAWDRGQDVHAWDRYETFRMPLVDEYGDVYLDELTVKAQEPGGPGPVRNIPNFNLTSHWIDGQRVPTGRYNIGVACTRLGALDRLWNTTVTVTEDASDPSGLALVVDDPKSATSVMLTAEPSDARTGQPVTLTATVEPDGMRGEVLFSGPVSGRGQVSEGRASFVVDDLPAGSHEYLARFEPSDLRHLPSTSDDLRVRIGEATADEGGDDGALSPPRSARGHVASAAASDAAPAALTDDVRDLAGVATGVSASSPLALVVATSSSLPVGVWAALMLVFARMAYLLATPIRIHPTALP